MKPGGEGALRRNMACEEELLRRYPQRLTAHLRQLLENGDDGALARQFLPDRAELDVYPGLVDDPLDEQQHTPLPGLVHRHADRVLLLASDRCGAICRFCFRKGRRFPSYEQLSSSERDELFAYLARQPEVKEVILTGGDPLTLDEQNLADLFERLEAIDHLQLLRVHTRLPVVDPERVTANLAQLLSRRLPLYVMLHVNHPLELSEPFARACARFTAVGIPLGSQTVLLKGVNDDSGTLEALFRGLLRQRVRPYYLHHPDLAAGTAHFRVSLERGRRLVEQLEGRLSGLAIPRYVVDLPGGRGKVNVAEQKLVSGGAEAVLRADDGSLVKVPNWEG